MIHKSKNRNKLSCIAHSALVLACFIVGSCGHVGTKDVELVEEEVEIVYSNKSRYTLHVGDTLEIYNTINTCCLHCTPNRDRLKHLEYLKSKTVIPNKPGCDGCNVTSAMVFVAKSEGSDTILQANIHPTQECIDTLGEFTEMIVHIIQRAQ